MLDVRFIAADLIDDPAEPVRESMDPQALADLAESIRAVGLIEPIIVKPVDGRFEVVAGHRRRLACQLIKLKDLKCEVLHDLSISTDALKVHENVHREPVNDAEQAVFYQRLLERECHNDTSELTTLLHASREHVEGRLLLLHGDQTVFAALYAGEISFAVARELNLVHDLGYRLSYLAAARGGNASARQIKQWRHATDGQTTDVGAAVSAAGTAAPGGADMRCFLCGRNHKPHTLVFLWIHDACKEIILDPLLDDARRPPPAPAPTDTEEHP